MTDEGAILALQVASYANGDLRLTEERLIALTNTMNPPPDVVLHARALVSRSRKAGLDAEAEASVITT
jgi:hypothetical protein